MRDRRQEIARIGQAIGPDRPAVWQRERIAVILADVGPRGAVDQLDAKNDAARNDADLARRDLNDTELGSETQAAVLCHHNSSPSASKKCSRVIDWVMNRRCTAMPVIASASPAV